MAVPGERTNTKNGQNDKTKYKVKKTQKYRKSTEKVQNPPGDLLPKVPKTRKYKKSIEKVQNLVHQSAKISKLQEKYRKSIEKVQEKYRKSMNK